MLLYIFYYNIILNVSKLNLQKFFGFLNKRVYFYFICGIIYLNNVNNLVIYIYVGID